MTLVDELKILNYSIIDCLKNKGLNFRRNEIIKEILKDESCFFKIEKQEAFVILRDLGIDEDKLEETYNELISSAEFYRLYNNGKIDLDDKDIKIKYKIYNPNDIFEKKEHTKTAVKESLPLEQEYQEKWYKKIISFIKRIFNK